MRQISKRYNIASWIIMLGGKPDQHFCHDRRLYDLTIKNKIFKNICIISADLNVYGVKYKILCLKNIRGRFVTYEFIYILSRDIRKPQKYAYSIILEPVLQRIFNLPQKKETQTGRHLRSYRQRQKHIRNLHISKTKRKEKNRLRNTKRRNANDMKIGATAAWQANHTRTNGVSGPKTGAQTETTTTQSARRKEKEIKIQQQRTWKQRQSQRK